MLLGVYVLAKDLDVYWRLAGEILNVKQDPLQREGHPGSPGLTAIYNPEFLRKLTRQSDSCKFCLGLCLVRTGRRRESCGSCGRISRTVSWCSHQRLDR